MNFSKYCAPCRYAVNMVSHIWYAQFQKCRPENTKEIQQLICRIFVFFWRIIGSPCLISKGAESARAKRPIGSSSDVKRGQEVKYLGLLGMWFMEGEGGWVQSFSAKAILEYKPTLFLRHMLTNNWLNKILVTCHSKIYQRMHISISMNFPMGIFFVDI